MKGLIFLCCLVLSFSATIWAKEEVLPDPEFFEVMPVLENLPERGEKLPECPSHKRSGFNLRLERTEELPEHQGFGTGQECGPMFERRDLGFGLWEKMIDIYLRHGEELKLTKEQVNSLEEIKLETEKEIVRKEADKKIVKLELRRIFRQDEIDFAQAKEKIKQLIESSQALMLVRLTALEKVQKVLTKEQQEKIKQLKREQFKLRGRKVEKPKLEKPRSKE